MTVSDLQLAESKHRYRDPRSGDLVVSVTRVVGSFDDGDKLGAGAGAAVKLTKLGIDYRKDWNDKRDRGSRLHTHIGRWAMGQTADVREDDEPLLDGFLAFCKAKHPVWLETERAVVSPLGYGGRFDLIGEIEGDFWLLDPKTGKEYVPELTLQMAGYASCDAMVVYDADGNACGTEPLPHIDRWGGLYLGAKTAHLVEVPPPPGAGWPYSQRYLTQRRAIDAFQHLFHVRRWVDEEKKREL